MNLLYEQFKDINLYDDFFDSLKEDYVGFDKWFTSKSEEYAYVFKNEHNRIDGFLYLKIENGVVDDVEPNLPSKHRLKVGTFKINAHGTKLGERFVKKIFDTAIYHKVEEVYVTAFPKHAPLIAILQKYGFAEKATKKTPSGVENVYVKDMSDDKAVGVLAYPTINLKHSNIYALSLYPIWHTRLLPDSILKNEDADIVQDVSHTNSIHKIYLTLMKGVTTLKPNDVLLIYRTTDGQGPAHYRSVITSICVVEETLHIDSFKDVESFVSYCNPYSIFDEKELREFWNKKKYPYIIKFSYNLALKKRVTRGKMIEEFGFNPDMYWGFFPVTKEQFYQIVKEGQIDESLIIN